MPPRAMSAAILNRSLISRPMRGSGAPVDFDIAAWARSAIQRCSRIDPVSCEALARRAPLFESVPGRFTHVNDEARRAGALSLTERGGKKRRNRARHCAKGRAMARLDE